MPGILFFPTNGIGMGHLTRCLAYARRLRGHAECRFFSLSSAVEYIEDMGFAADYFISPAWSHNTSYTWNTELAMRLGMILERTRPDLIVFDGTWPFQGLLAACRAYTRPLKLVWSRRGGLKEEAKTVSVDEALFAMILQPGEMGATYRKTALWTGGVKLAIPPVLLLDNSECLSRKEGRRQLNFAPQGRYALVSLGAGNLNDVDGIGYKLIQRLQAAEYTVVWACPAISVRDIKLPFGVRSLSIYPLTRYMRSFDCMVGAAGYNTCHEVVQAQIPCILVPNMQTTADDQARRAQIVTEHAPAIVSSCETEEKVDMAVRSLMRVVDAHQPSSCALSMNGAHLAAEAILALAGC